MVHGEGHPIQLRYEWFFPSDDVAADLPLASWLVGWIKLNTVPVVLWYRMLADS